MNQLGRTSRTTRSDARNAIQTVMKNDAEWKIDNWPAWIVVGRIIPERCQVNAGPFSAKTLLNNNPCVVIIDIKSSHLSVIVRVPSNDFTLFQLSEIVKSVIRFPIDYIAQLNRGYYDICLDTVTDTITGNTDTFPIFEPIFNYPVTNSYFLISRTKPIEIPFHIASVALTDAIHDLGQAVRYSRRSLEYCRMALESIRHHFDPDNSSLTWRQRYSAGQAAMCAALKLSSDTMQNIENSAAPSRHGEPSYDMTWNIRKLALEFSWETVERFKRFLSGEDTSSWRVFS